MDDYENFDHEDNSQYNVSQEEELIFLLKSWNQEFLIEHFLAEGVYINVLKVIKYHHIDKLLKKFDLGTQILFEHNLEEWRAAIGLPMIKNDVCIPGSSSPTLSATSEVNTSSSNRFTPYPLSRPSSPNTTPSITLSKILTESPKGVMLNEYYKKFSCFEDEQRTLLISTIAQFFQEKNEDMSLSTSYRLEREITETYPTEKLEYYRTNKRGKLYNKFSNLKTTFKSVSKFLTKSKTSCGNDCHEQQMFSHKQERIFIPEKEAENFFRMLKFDNLSCIEFDNCWKACSNYRLKEIKEAVSMEDIFKKWPFFKTPNGYRLIEMDFNVLFQTGDQLLDKWESIAPKLLQFLCNNFHVKDKQIRGQLEFLKKENITENTRDAVLFWSLHGYFVPTNKTVKKNDSGKNNVIKYTIKDSQESFIFIGSCAQQIEEHLECLHKSKNLIQPLILGLGDDIQNLREIYVYFDGTKYIFTNFLRAVDICFKIFYVFNSYFPKQSVMFWNFFETYFYKIKNNNSFSKVHILIEALSRNASVPILSPGPMLMVDEKNIECI